MSKTAIYTGDDAGTVARKKARYSHRSWLFWVDRNGVKHSGVMSAETTKAAMLACGTQKHFMVYNASTGTGMVVTWNIAAMWLRNFKYGFLK